MVPKGRRILWGKWLYLLWMPWERELAIGDGVREVADKVGGGKRSGGEVVRYKVGCRVGHSANCAKWISRVFSGE